MKLKKITAAAAAALMLEAALPFMAFALDTTDSPHNTLQTAVEAVFDTEYSGQITADDNRDFYKLVLPESGILSTQMFSENIRQIRYYLYAEDGETEIATVYFSRSNNTLQIKETKDLYLNKGVYYIAVSNTNTLDSYYGDYNFLFKFESAKESFEETGTGTDNTYDTANTIELNTSYNGFIAFEDDYDMFKFTLDQKTTVTFAAEAFYDYFDYDIYDENQKKLAGTTELMDSKSQRNLINKKLTLEAGTYYVCINRYFYNNYVGSYTFSVNANENLGDINSDGEINAVDSSMALSAYASEATGNGLGLSDDQISAADVNGDNSVNAVDASAILSYYAYIATGGEDTIAEFLGL